MRSRHLNMQERGNPRGVTRDLAGCGSYRRRGGEVRLDNLFDGINLPDCVSLCQKIIHLEYFH